MLCHGCKEKPGVNPVKRNNITLVEYCEEPECEQKRILHQHTIDESMQGRHAVPSSDRKDKRND